MYRRHLLRSAAALPLAALARPAIARLPARVRPGEADWPTDADWDSLASQIGGQLTRATDPLAPCRADPDGATCTSLFRSLKNPYAIADAPNLTQTCGWVDAWWTSASSFIAAPRSSEQVAKVVGFAREHRLRLVVRGGGHSYLGTSNAPDSLLLWTRALDGITLHDAFTPAGTDLPPVPAVSLGAGAIWRQAYDAVVTASGRYVQGGGCLTVGVAGLIQGGGFGSFSKAFGTAGQNLLEAEIVTADSRIRVVNAANDPELFWALKGGGAGTFGVVTRLTVRTHELPATMGAVALTVTAATDNAWRTLLGRFIAHYADNLFTPHWGELVRATPGRRLIIGMNFQGLTAGEAEALWQPFVAWASSQPDLAATQLSVVAGAARHRWDAAMLERVASGIVQHDDRPGAAPDHVFWTANRAEAGHVIHDFQSLWFPADLLASRRQSELVDALVQASRHWDVEMHFQKGLAGASDIIRDAARDTPMNPIVADSFMLAIIASEGPPAFPRIEGHLPDDMKARRDRSRIARAMEALRRVAPGGGAYCAESDYFQPDWQQAYWGANYPRLQAVKTRYDPETLFFVRHGVGSEAWSDDGFTLLS